MTAPPFATGVGNYGGPHGTTFISSTYFTDPVQWEVWTPSYVPGRSAIENAYVHELGNLASFYGSNGTSYGLFGNTFASDADSGYQLQLCVYGVPGFSDQPFDGPI